MNEKISEELVKKSWDNLLVILVAIPWYKLYVYEIQLLLSSSWSLRFYIFWDSVTQRYFIQISLINYRIYSSHLDQNM